MKSSSTSKKVKKIVIKPGQGISCDCCGKSKGLLFPCQIYGTGEVLVYCKECRDEYLIPNDKLKEIKNGKQ